VDRLSLGSGAEQAGDLRVAFLVGLLGEGGVLAAGLRFAGEGGF